MDTQLRWHITAGFDHMDGLHARPSGKRTHQSRDTAIGGIGHTGQDNRDIELQLFRHKALPGVEKQGLIRLPEQRLSDRPGKLLPKTARTNAGT